MAMKDLPHPGRRLKTEIRNLGLSTAQGAAALGISRAQLHRVMAGDSAISPELAIRLELVIGGSAEGWVALQAVYDVTKARQRLEGLREELAFVGEARRQNAVEAT